MGSPPSNDPLLHACHCSRFLERWCDAYPDRLQARLYAGALSPGQAALAGIDAPDMTLDGKAGVALRLRRNEQMAMIALRDLAAIDTVEQTLAALSDLADHLIEAALGEAERQVAERHGYLRDSQGIAARLIVIGMGKLGGAELNFSSDIDLIFAFDQAGDSDGAKPLDAASYFTRIAQRLVQLLSETTANGFVYRVDTRLRPFGDAGALVASITAMESYYQTHGREWERYAWVKARPVAGDIPAGQRLLATLRPFVYRRYLDYGTFESIREMKALIDRQVASADMAVNIKLGRGGIREIEFIAQAFQLIRGGQEPALQDQRLLPTLARLGEAGHLPEELATQLAEDYLFLRRTENHLQMLDDQQTHELPDDAADQRIIALSMGHAGRDEFLEALAGVRERVQQVFEQVFVSPQASEPSTDAADELLALWEGSLSPAATQAVLARHGLQDIDAITSALADLHKQSLYRMLEERGRRWIAQLVPLLFAASAAAEDPQAAILRTLSVIAAIVGRSTYIALLVEHPAALSTLMRLCAASQWITDRIREQPALLDTLLDPRLLYRPPPRAALSDEIATDLQALAAGDLEQLMDTLRRFAQGAMLRIAAADVTDAMPLMIVSDHLTALAEVVLEAALDIAWQQMQPRYGEPLLPDGQRAPFAIIAYGKLGGTELGYTSDLDLVFIYDGPTEAMSQGGTRELSHQAYFIRLAQRLIHILATQTGAGRAYEIDMRLRPSGNAGLMVTHIDAFARYQAEEAWNWEHQALVRARFVAGDTRISERFGQLRREILGSEREPQRLAGEVADMRDRMRKVKDESTPQQIDVKQMAGGLIDIEFMAQFAVLRHAHSCPELLIFTDAIRVIETLESAGLIERATAATLTDSYRLYRSRTHADSLQRRRAMIDADQWRRQREAVAALWQAWIVDTHAAA